MPMPTVQVEYFLAVDESGNTVIDETPTEAAALLAERYDSACNRIVQLTVIVPVPTIEHTRIEVPEPEGATEISAADAI